MRRGKGSKEKCQWYKNEEKNERVTRSKVNKINNIVWKIILDSFCCIPFYISYLNDEKSFVDFFLANISRGNNKKLLNVVQCTLSNLEVLNSNRLLFYWIGVVLIKTTRKKSIRLFILCCFILKSNKNKTQVVKIFLRIFFTTPKICMKLFLIQ